MTTPDDPYKDADFILRLRPLTGFGWRIVPVQRIRGLLKVALRRFGMRCVDLRPVTADTAPPPEKGRANGSKADGPTVQSAKACRPGGAEPKPG